VARTKRQPRSVTDKAEALAQIMARAPTKMAFGVLAAEDPVSFLVECPWCHGHHVHAPGDQLVQVCPAQGHKYLVMIPLSQLPS
jgi:hypothetical protein